jgi:hypothetical protein
LNLFEIAILKNKINNLPSDYYVSKDRKLKVTAKYITSIFINKEEYNVTSFNDDIDFQLFIYDNFYKINKIIETRSTIYMKYYLRKGLLHNFFKYSYTKYRKSNNKILIESYFIRGKEIAEELFKQQLRKYKFQRVLKNE